MTHDLDTHRLAGAYALDALADTERRRFERHLRGCAACADEAAGFRETAARLALAAARRPPDELRGRVMAEIARTRQSPPLARRLPSPRARGPVWLAAAACLVLVLVLAGAGAAWRVQRSAEREQSLNRQVAAVMSAPDARTSTVRTPAAATVTVVSSRSLGKAVVTTNRMPPLPSARTYQMWWLGPAAPRSAGTMNPAESDRPVIATGLGGARRIGVTVEPAGGSARPSGAPILTLAVG